MDEELLKQVYDRYKPKMERPSVSAEVVGSGSYAYYYKVTAVNETGETDAHGVTVSNAPETLSDTSYIILRWNPVLYAKKYRVYGRLSGPAFGLMTETEDVSFTDYGVLAPDSSKRPPTENKTGRYGWENVVFLPGRGLQSAELNEIQSVLYEKIKALGGAFFQNGDIVEGCDIRWTGNGVEISEGKVYAWGAVRTVEGGFLPVPFLGTWYVGLNVYEDYIDSTDDDALLDPAQGYPGYAQAGAARRLLRFVWAWAMKKEDLDIPMWEVKDSLINPVRPVYEYSVLDKVIARKLHSLHGYVLVNGFTSKISPDPFDRDKILIAIAPGTAFVNGREIRKTSEVRLRETIATDLSEEMLEEVSPESGYLYKLSLSPVAAVGDVDIRQKISETRTVPSTRDNCNWYYDVTGYRVYQILGVWNNSSKEVEYTFSNTDPGCAERSYDVHLSSNGFALDPTVFTQGNTYYIEYLIYSSATKGKRSRAQQTDTFTFDPNDLTYQLSKRDGIKSERSPIVIKDSQGNNYLENIHWTVDLNKTNTSIGYPIITFLSNDVMPEGEEFYVTYYYWDHEVEGDFVSIDSYVSDFSSYDYEDVEYKDYIDFRTDSSLKPSTEDSDILVEYQVFLSQYAWLVLDDEGNFRLIRGVSSTMPSRMKTPEGVLPLSCIYLPAFSQYPFAMDTTRYRVAKDYDVNVLRERVERLEYNLALTTLEQEALSKHTIQPKRGLFTEAFVDNIGMDTNASTCSIDSRKGRALLRRNMDNSSILPDRENSTDISFWESTATISATETPIDDQLMWTEGFAKEIPAFLFARPQVSAECFPKIDLYYSDSVEKEVLIHTVEVPTLVTFPSNVNVDDAKELLKDFADRDSGWVFTDEELNFTPGTVSLALTRSSQSELSTVSLKSAEIMAETEPRTIVMIIRGCQPYEDGIYALIDKVWIPLSIASNDDLANVGLNITSTGEAGTYDGTVKADADGNITAKFTLPAGLSPGQKLVEVMCVADLRFYTTTFFFTQGMRREFVETQSIVRTAEKLYVGTLKSTQPPPSPPAPSPSPSPSPPSVSTCRFLIDNAYPSRTYIINPGITEFDAVLAVRVRQYVPTGDPPSYTGTLGPVTAEVLGPGSVPTTKMTVLSVTVNTPDNLIHMKDGVSFHPLYGEWGHGIAVRIRINEDIPPSEQNNYYAVKVTIQNNTNYCGGSDYSPVTFQMINFGEFNPPPPPPPPPPGNNCPQLSFGGSGAWVGDTGESIAIPVRVSVTDSLQTGWSGQINLTVSTNVPGGNASVSPTVLSFSGGRVQYFDLTFTHSPISSTGNYAATISASANLGSNCGGTRVIGSATVSLRVSTTAPPKCPRFAMIASPNSFAIQNRSAPSVSTTLVITDTANSGWTGTLNLTVTGFTGGRTGSVTPPSVTFSGSRITVPVSIQLPYYDSVGRWHFSINANPVGLPSGCPYSSASAALYVNVTEPQPQLPPPYQGGDDWSCPEYSMGDGGGGGDPLFQTFTLKEGRVISSIDLWFYRVSHRDYPVEVGIRPLTDSGLPDKRQLLARKALSRAQIMEKMGITDTSELLTQPTLSNRVTFSFPDPVYLPPGDYGFYVATNAPGYYVYSAVLGKNVLGSLDEDDQSRIGNPLAMQAHDGVLMVSTNNVTWQVELENDLMFRINALTVGETNRGRLVLNAGSLPDFHEFALLLDSVIPPQTSIKSFYSANSMSWKEFLPALISEDNSLLDFANVGVVGTSLSIALDLQTADPMLTPIVRLVPMRLIRLKYNNTSIYQTKELRFGGQTFENIEGWVDVLENGGTVAISASFDHGNTWYTVPTIGEISLSDGFKERNFGGSLGSISGGEVTESEYVILRVTMSSGSSTRWASPQIKRFRFVVY